MTKIFSRLALGLATSALMLGMPLAVAAQTPSSSDRVQDGLNSIRDTYPEGVQGETTYNVSDIVKKVIDWALYLAAIIAVIFIIIGGFYYITARGSDAQAAQGRKTLVNALIGLTLVILSYLIVQIVYNFLVRPGT